VAIGPEARRAASGRIVVVATLQGTLGAASLVVGLGPRVSGAPPMTQAVGLASIVLGTILIIGAVALGLRTRHARLLGLAGAIATVLVGLLVFAAALASEDDCVRSNGPSSACALLLGAVEVAGLSVTAAGLASAVVIHRARPQAFRRHRH
jgi:hypothetical protein